MHPSLTDLEESDFTTIQPREAEEITITLGLYELPLGEPITVQATGYLHVALPGTTQLIDPVYFLTNKISMILYEGLEGTNSTIHYEQQELTKRAIIFPDCDEQLVQLIEQDLSNCQQLADHASLGTQETEDWEFFEYFEWTEEIARPLIRVRYRSIARQCGSPYARSGISCSDRMNMCKGDIAYTMPAAGEGITVLCDLY